MPFLFLSYLFEHVHDIIVCVGVYCTSNAISIALRIFKFGLLDQYLRATSKSTRCQLYT